MALPHAKTVSLKNSTLDHRYQKSDAEAPRLGP